MATEQMKIVVQIDGKDNASPALNTVDSNVKKLNQTSEEGSKSAKTLGESWGSFKDHATSFIGAAALVSGAIYKINELGAQANAAEKTFTQVTGGADEAAASLARMRQQTGGVIDDMSLMKGASSLLVTGIAQTNEQAEQLVNLGARLGTVMGVDAAESIQNLNSALLNNSFMRLDTLGISAAAVRERVNELKEAGMDMSEAFSQAVLEIGTQTLTDLGDAAKVGETAINRMSTSLTNMGQNIAQGVNVELEKFLVTVEQLAILGNLAATGNTGIPEIDAQIAKTEQLTDRTNELILAREQALLQQNVQVQDLGMLGVSNQQFMDYAAQHPELINAAGSIGGRQSNIASGSFFTDAISGDMAGDAAEAKRILGELTDMDLSGFDTSQLLVVARDADIAFSSIAQAQEELQAQTLETTKAQIAQTEILEAQTAALTDFSVLEAQAVDNLADLRTMNESLTASMQAGAFSSVSGASFFDPAQLSQVQAQTEEIVSEYERLKELGEASDFTLVSELEVERAKEIAEQAEATATQAERSAKAYENASLAVLAGVDNGGRENEFNQQVLARIEDPEQRAALERQMNLNSGKENANTDVLSYGYELSAQIASEKGTAAGAEASETFEHAFEEGIRLGLSGEALKTYIEGEVGFALSGEVGSSGAEITVQAGEGYLDVAARTGYSREELEAANGGGAMLMAGQVIYMPDGSALIAVGEEKTTEDVTSNILGNAASGIMPAATPDQYTYYDTSTQSLVGSNDPTAQDQAAAFIPPEMSETTSQMATDMLAVQESVMTISQTDVSAALDPMITDIDVANVGVTDFESSMKRLTRADWSLEVPIAFVFDDQTAETLARNTQVVEVIKLILPQLGVEMSQ